MEQGRTMEQALDGQQQQGSKKVCVTGASGFIASWVVKLLLERGYTVHATVRSLNDPRKTEHLRALDGAEARLRLFEANLLDEGSFDAAIDGCSGVFHTASPVIVDSSTPQADLIDPALKGTLNVLASCAKFSSVKRVVFTSSTAAVLFNGTPLTNETVVDETWFSSPECCKGSMIGEGYVLSKTLAEDAAWKFVKEKGIDMVSINPVTVIGPLLQPTISWSIEVLLNLVNGSETYMNVSFGWVHVKDVAEAHILAFETPTASGRYILCETVAHFSDVVEILRELYPTRKLPTKCADDQPFKPTYKISKDRAKSLGIVLYTPLKDALKETVECLVEKKLISS